jgi:hypothetical protein
LLGLLSEVAEALLHEASKLSNLNDREISFQDFVVLVHRPERSLAEQPLEGPDPKVFEFLKILEEYRIKCEDEGNYLEASRANKQLDVLRKQEEKRQQKAIRARHTIERQDIQVAHSMQYHEFNRAWDQYMEEFDSMAQKYIHQMTERHATSLLDFQQKLRDELAKKPPKWSRELIEQRRQQAINAKSRNYAEAQRLKLICDRIEMREKGDIEQNLSVIFARREALFRQHQQIELQALLKRIECRRKEHVKQRNLDCKRLLQRNRNVQAVLESKQSLECQRLFDEIKKSLHIHHILSSNPGTKDLSNAVDLNATTGSKYMYDNTESFHEENPIHHEVFANTENEPENEELRDFTQLEKDDFLHLGEGNFLPQPEMERFDEIQVN